MVRLATWSCCAALSLSTPALAQDADPFAPSVVSELDVSEVVRLGGYDERDAFVFSSISTGALLSEEEVALVDRLSNEVRVFDMAGTHLRTFGREGEGPGEFKYLRVLQTLPDERLLAWDFQAKRVSVFELDGTHVRTVSLRVSPYDFLWTNFVGAFRDGSFVVRSDPSVMSMRSDPVGPRQDPTHFVRHAASGEVVDTLCTVVGPEKHLYREGNSWDLEGRLFEREVVGATAGDALMCGSTERLDLRRIMKDGSERSRLTIQRPARAISEAEIELERERLEEEARAREGRRTQVVAEALGARVAESSWDLRRLAEREAHLTRPTYRSLMVGSEGEIWIEDYSSPEADSTRWYLLEGDRVAGWVGVGNRESVLAFGHGFLVKRIEDELGVQTAVLMRITQPDA